MKKTILAIALLLSVTTSMLSSCMVQDRRGHRDNGRHRGHSGPHDSNGYNNHYRNY